MMLPASRHVVLLAIAALLLIAVPSLARQHDFHWSDEFTPGDFNASVSALVEFDDGKGSVMFAGGSFSEAPGGVAARFVARWDGRRWHDAGARLNGSVSALCVADLNDGAGPALYAAGEFWFRGENRHALGVARWDGAQWAPVGPGLAGFANTICVFDDPVAGAPRLVAAGYFGTFDGRTYNSIAMWDGDAWLPLASGLRYGTALGLGYALLQHDAGNGPRLIIGGRFNTAGGVACNSIAEWDGAKFRPLGSGVVWPGESTPALVLSLHASAALSPASPPRLIVGGAFSRAGAVPANNIASWDGTAFAPIGDGLPPAVNPSNAVYALADFHGQLHAGGDFGDATAGPDLRNLARWDGIAWRRVAEGATGNIYSLLPLDRGGAPRLVVAGAAFYGQWDGDRFEIDGNGLNGVPHDAVFTDLGDGSALYVVGDFSLAGSTSVRGIARWDGHAWTALGAGIEIASLRTKLAALDDGSGPALYVASRADRGIARWDGHAWTFLPVDPLATVLCDIALFPHDGAECLHALSGHNSFGTLTYRLSRLVDGRWEQISGGFAGSWPFGSLQRFDKDPNGPSLYVGSSFSRFGLLDSNNIVRTDGTGVFALDAGVNGFGVSGLEVARVGASVGAALFVSGGFSTAGPMTGLSGFAGWNGSEWFRLGGPGEPLPGAGSGSAVAAWRDTGDLDAVFLAGGFRVGKDNSPAPLLRWTPGDGFIHFPDAPIFINAIAAAGAGPGSSLYVVGNFRSAGGRPAGGIARLVAGTGCAADWNHDGGLDTRDFFGFLDDFLVADADFNADGLTDSPDWFDFLAAYFLGCP